MHALICGVTQSGKTTLAHLMAGEFSRKGQNVIVYDPLGTATSAGTWPKSARIFSTPESFAEYMARDDVSHAHVFIDEAYDLFGIANKDNFWLLTRGRHFGFVIYMIAQRPKMIAPTARTQCGRAYMFRLAQDDARELCADFGHGRDIFSIGLDRGDFVVLESGSARVSRGNVFNLRPSPRKPE